MKHALLLLTLIIGLLLTGCEDADIGMATQAGIEAVKAVTLDNEELLFVVGHEMGHVVDDHIKKKIRLAYAGSAVRKAIASQRNDHAFLSSHPAPEARAERLRETAQTPGKAKKPSLLGRVIAWLKAL
jgi:Zn-dependent protease with chaperone function